MRRLRLHTDHGSQLRLLRRIPDLRVSLGVGVLIVIVMSALAADLVAPFDPASADVRARLLPPGTITTDGDLHLLGTDNLGRDVLSRVVYGGRISLMVGFAAVILAGVLGVATGLAAGYYGRHTDQIVMRWVDVQMAFPTVVLAIAVLAILGNSFVNVIIVLTISSWVVYARLTRAVTLSIREKEFVEGAVAAGAGDVRILTRYILPNVLPSIIVIATYQFAAMVIAESALSFLGLGVPPPAPSWGSGISSGRDYLSQAWWVTTMPGVALMLTIMAVTLIGDWVRDRLDPTLGM